MIADHVLQDALEQHGKLGRGTGSIVLRQFQHGVLHHVEREVRIAHGIYGLLVGPPLRLREKIRKFLRSRHYGGCGR